MSDRGRPNGLANKPLRATPAALMVGAVGAATVAGSHRVYPTLAETPHVINVAKPHL